MRGKLERYFYDKGYGFIRAENGRSYFFHKSHVRNMRGYSLERGDMLSFAVIGVDNHFQAIDVVPLLTFKQVRRAVAIKGYRMKKVRDAEGVLHYMIVDRDTKQSVQERLMTLKEAAIWADVE